MPLLCLPLREFESGRTYRQERVHRLFMFSRADLCPAAEGTRKKDRSGPAAVGLPDSALLISEWRTTHLPLPLDL